MTLTVEERIRMLSSEVEQCLNLEPDLFISSAVIDENIHVWIEYENYWIELDPYGIFEYGASRGVMGGGESLAGAIADEEKRYRLMEESRITREEFVAELRKNGIPFDNGHVFPFGVAEASWRHDSLGLEIWYRNLDWTFFNSNSEPVWSYQGYSDTNLATAIKRFKSRHQ
jgi:hypothetical protein